MGPSTLHPLVPITASNVIDPQDWFHSHEVLSSDGQFNQKFGSDGWRVDGPKGPVMGKNPCL
jgi:hypothetical protein